MECIFDNTEYISADNVMRLVGCRLSKLGRMVRANQFPKPMKLDIVNWWKKSEVEEYLRQKGGQTDNALTEHRSSCGDK